MKYAVMLKKMKRRCIKTKRTLVEHKTVTDINLKSTANWFLRVCTETAPEVERNKTKLSQIHKLTDVFVKQIYSKS